jgi:flagellar basal body rod protein FlgG
LALQGDGFFKLRPLNSPLTPDYQVYYTRDGEFRWMKLPAGAGYYPSSPSATPVIANDPNYTIYVLVNAQGLGVCARDAGGMGDNTNDDYVMHLIVHNVTGVTGYGSSPSSLTPGMNLQQYLDTGFVNDLQIRDFDDRQSLTYSQYGSTVFKPGSQLGNEKVVDHTETTILSKSLEASNASMTQSVPELSLAQKLFSALTKVLQTKQTNVDGVLNLVR